MGNPAFSSSQKSYETMAVSIPELYEYYDEYQREKGEQVQTSREAVQLSEELYSICAAGLVLIHWILHHPENKYLVERSQEFFRESFSDLLYAIKKGKDCILRAYLRDGARGTGSAVIDQLDATKEGVLELMRHQKMQERGFIGRQFPLLHGTIEGAADYVMERSVTDVVNAMDTEELAEIFYHLDSMQQQYRCTLAAMLKQYWPREQFRTCIDPDANRASDEHQKAMETYYETSLQKRTGDSDSIDRHNLLLELLSIHTQAWNDRTKIRAAAAKNYRGCSSRLMLHNE